MYRTTIGWLGCVLALGFTTTGCSNSSATPAATAVGGSYLLKSEPAGAIEIIDAREKAKDGEPIVVVGRLGGGLNPWIDGRAAFLLVDTRILPSCEEGEQCEADCPDCAAEMAEASAMVKFLGEDGKVLSTDARALLGVKEQETVVIEGVANRDKSGAMSIAAKGIFVRR